MLKGKHEGLVSLRTFSRVQERMKKAARVCARNDINENFPLRGFVTCAECDNLLISFWSKSKTGKTHP